ncbi:toll/interleukin-1 receptor domain-containing protein [Marinobacter alexandrii]|uniref:toll/interleukin-1 receptor domain-containing protein n=1 Tax=Marinobacter alexandrii TaxID=2570351 RepID=UPI0011089F4F|nr:toll/interleukin-1 receptor domain-containing protein [Marinobacter alexandrii]
MNPPRVFVSYSHDSADHKRWVLDFATTLRNRGIDAILDQWDLKPGDDLPHFMETQLDSAQYVLMICSNRYVEKANAGEGGVGYEKMILTSNLLSKIDSAKVIPIIRQPAGTYNTPTFLRTKLFVNFSNDAELEFSFDELLRHLLDAPLFEKPEIGSNPFKPMENSAPDRSSDGIKEVMKAVARCYNKTSASYISFHNLLSELSMHRITSDKYLLEARQAGLLTTVQNYASRIKLTPIGREYLFEHDIVDK